MSAYVRYHDVDLREEDEQRQSLARLVEKSNNVIEVLEAVGRPISDRGIEKIESINKRIDQINNTDSSSLQGTQLLSRAIRDIGSFYPQLKDAALDGLLQDKDALALLSSKRARDVALGNLRKQESIIEGYAKRLEDATAKTSQNIEQTTTGLLSSKIQERVNELSKKPSIRARCFIEWIDSEEGDESQLQESVYYWYKKRQWSLRDLGVFVLLIVALEILVILEAVQLTDISSASLLVLRATIFVLLYTRYYFAQKNYRIYASLLAKYNHMLVNAKMLNGYMDVENKDPELYKNLVEKVTNLITSPIEDHHFKNTSDNDTPATVVKNIVSDVAKGK